MQSLQATQSRRPVQTATLVCTTETTAVRERPSPALAVARYLSQSGRMPPARKARTAPAGASRPSSSRPLSEPARASRSPARSSAPYAPKRRPPRTLARHDRAEIQELPGETASDKRVWAHGLQAAPRPRCGRKLYREPPLADPSDQPSPLRPRSSPSTSPRWRPGPPASHQAQSPLSSRRRHLAAEGHPRPTQKALTSRTIASPLRAPRSARSDRRPSDSPDPEVLALWSGWLTSSDRLRVARLLAHRLVHHP